LWKTKLIKWLPLIITLATVMIAPYIKTIWGDIPNPTI